MMEPLFGYDLVNGELVENHIEADFVRFQFALEIGQKPEPPFTRSYPNKGSIINRSLWC